MVNIPDDPKVIIESAIANEIEGHKILQRGKKAANTRLGQATFEFLSSEELHHIELIKEFAQSLEGVKEWDPSEMRESTLSDSGAGIKGLFERFGTQFEEVAATENERLEAYEVAMDMERRGYEFYSRAAEKVTDGRARSLFKFLAGEEQRHFQIIQDTHDFLDHPDGLLAMEERWMQT